jgi:hypothetical protein
LETCFQSWFEQYPRVETTCGLATSILAADDLWPQVEFVSLMQALEGLHRALFQGSYMNAAEYAQVERTLIDAIKALPATVSGDHREALRSRIHYGNELSLAKRLTSLCSMLSEPVREMVFGDAAKLPRKWIETRNYYTHWEAALLPGILSIQEMIYSNQRMRALLRVLYLSLAGVPQEVLSTSLRGTNKEAQSLTTIRGMERRASNPNDMTGAFGFIARGQPARTGRRT